MKKRITILLIITLLCSPLLAQNSKPHLRKQGETTQLWVDGAPFIILGGETGNSSATATSDIDRIFPKLQAMNLNTVLLPAYWELFEPEETRYDFSLIDHIILKAEEHHLKVVLLWFGAWKNSMSCYAPAWFKADYERFPRAVTKNGKPLEIASSFSDNVFQADKRALSHLMKYLAERDINNTVIMLQIENEIGMLEDARDHSIEANKLFNSPVPDELMKQLSMNKMNIHPWLAEKWAAQGNRTLGSWSEVFGEDIYTDEIFMAWHYALYVEGLAQEARKQHDIPLFVNAAMNSRGRKPGEYPSAGPLAHLKDIWKAAAPNIDFLSPDIYDKDFAYWVDQYKMPDNPLFVPEARLSDNAGVQAFYILGEHDALGYSPFSIEDAYDTTYNRLGQAYSKLKELTPLLTKYQGHGNSKGLLFDQVKSERRLLFDDLHIRARHFFVLPWDARATDGSTWPEGGGIILRLSKNEYIVAGCGIVLEFEKPGEQQLIANLGEDGFVAQGGNALQDNSWNGTSRCGLASVDEISIDQEGNFNYIRRLNGDQTHQGRHVRIGVDEFSILHVKLYEYK